jgi:hypothetical protein
MVFLKGEKTLAKHVIFKIITPYIRMLSSDWLMKGIFFLPILGFSSFSAIAGVFA